MSALSPKQEKYCVARAEGQSCKHAAIIAGVSEPTAWRWNADPAIVARIDALLDVVTGDAVRVLRAKTRRAAERIGELMEPGYNLGGMGSVNLQAAVTTLKMAGLEPAEKKDLTVHGEAKVYLDTVMEDV